MTAPEHDDPERPANCRNRLRDEGKPYPRSGCDACADFLFRGCPYDAASRAQRAEAEATAALKICSNATNRLVAAYAREERLREALIWLDRWGGLGLDVHAFIRSALSDTAQAPDTEEPSNG